MNKFLCVTVTILLAISSICLAVADPLYEEIHGDGVFTTSEKVSGEKRATRIAKDFERRDFEAMADHTTRAISAIVTIGARNLRLHGYKEDARYLEKEWKKHRKVLFKLAKSRDIGDFEPLSKYLAVAYEILEFKLGYKLCYILRLTDIKTINYAVPVVFQPCKHGLPEFTLHFVHDEKYRGLAPVVTYWTTVIACSIATYGAGYFFVCSPIGLVTELAMDKVVAPWLAPKLYSLICE